MQSINCIKGATDTNVRKVRYCEISFKVCLNPQRLPMPKEITHWLIAAHVADELKGTVLGNAVASNRYCLRLGAVFHDALYYLPEVSKIARFLALAYQLHGTKGEDTYDIVRNLAVTAGNSNRPGPLMAFLVGVVSHIHADALFHPLVHSVTADYSYPGPDQKTRAIQAHRRYETLMDLYFCGGLGSLKQYSLKVYLEKAEIPPFRLLDEALATVAREKGLPGLSYAVARAFRNFAIMQSLYKIRILSGLLYRLEPFVPCTLKEISALFYSPQLTAKLPELSMVINYHNPLTGQALSQSLKMIFDTTVQKSAAVCRTIEPAIVHKVPLQLSERGPSMESSPKSIAAKEASPIIVTSKRL